MISEKQFLTNQDVKSSRCIQNRRRKIGGKPVSWRIWVIQVLPGSVGGASDALRQVGAMK